MGIAYSAGPPETLELPFPPNADQVAWEKALAEQRGDPPPKVPTSLSLEGMAALLPMSEWDADDYTFRGPVKMVRPIDDSLGRKAWRLRVTVMRLADEDADLDVLVTGRAWQGKEPPKVGEEIEGRLWLQGRLWNAQKWIDAAGTE